VLIDLFPGHRLLAHEYLNVLLDGMGPEVETRVHGVDGRAPANVLLEGMGPKAKAGRRVVDGCARADVAFVSDFGEWSRDLQAQLLERYGRLLFVWWNDEEELLRAVRKNPEILRHQGITHFFFFEEACQAASQLGFLAFYIKPLFAAIRHFRAAMACLGGITRRYLVAMEVSWIVSHPESEGTTTRFEESNHDRRKFLSFISSRREDFLLVGPDMGSTGVFARRRLPQRNPGFFQIMPFFMYLSCGVIELGSKSGRSSVTPRLADSLAVGTPVHALAFGSENVAMPGVTWYSSVEALAMLPKPAQISRLERATIRSSLRQLQLDEGKRVFSHILEGDGFSEEA